MTNSNIDISVTITALTSSQNLKAKSLGFLSLWTTTESKSAFFGRTMMANKGVVEMKKKKKKTV